MVDLASMRDAMKELGSDPDKINPLVHLLFSAFLDCSRPLFLCGGW